MVLVLHEEPWSWQLFQVGDEVVLSVLCGTTGMYEVTIILDIDERRAWSMDGAAGLAPLVDAVMSSPPSYLGRDRPDMATLLRATVTQWRPRPELGR